MDKTNINQTLFTENTNDTKEHTNIANVIKREIKDIDDLIFPDDEQFYISER